MGEVAEMMLDGTLCECCGVYIHDGEAEGFPRYCSPQCAEDRGGVYIPPQGDGSGKRRRAKKRRARIAAKNRDRLAAADSTGWEKYCDTHWHRSLNGETLHYWPSTGKFMFRGEVHKGEDVNDFIKVQGNESHD